MILVHTRSTNVCPQCSKVFRNIYNLRRHIKIHHSGPAEGDPIGGPMGGPSGPMEGVKIEGQQMEQRLYEEQGPMLGFHHQ